MSWDTYGQDSSEDFTLPGPPTGLAVAVIAADVVALAPLLFDRALSWIGYAIASWVVAILAIVFREVDRRREANPLYLPRPTVRRTVNIGALVGLLIGCLHAWRVAQETTYA